MADEEYSDIVTLEWEAGRAADDDQQPGARWNSESMRPQVAVAERKARRAAHKMNAGLTSIGEVSHQGDSQESFSWQVPPCIQAARQHLADHYHEYQRLYPNEWVALEGPQFLGHDSEETALFERFNPDGRLRGRFYTEFIYSE